MSKLAIVYWSGTGNTESMAAMVAAGAKEAGAPGDLFTAAEFGPQQMDQIRTLIRIQSVSLSAFLLCNRSSAQALDTTVLTYPIV